MLRVPRSRNFLARAKRPKSVRIFLAHQMNFVFLCEFDTRSVLTNITSSFYASGCRSVEQKYLIKYNPLI